MSEPKSTKVSGPALNLSPRTSGESSSPPVEERAPPEKASDEIRQQLAKDLHDTISQSLTAIYLSTKFLERKLADDGSDRARDVSELGDAIHDAVRELHGIMSGLLTPGGVPVPAQPEAAGGETL